MKVSIIVPVFNEERTIQEIIRRIKSSQLPKNFSKEIIVVDDCSADSSLRIIKKIAGIKIVTHVTNLGKGAAVKSGLRRAIGDVVLIQDADLEYSPSDYKKLLLPFRSKSCQAVFGTRLIHYPLILNGPQKTPMPFHLLANRFLSWLTRRLYGGTVTDMETCYKIVRANLIRSLDLQANRFDFEPEITAKLLKRGVRIIEIPIRVSPRSYQEGKKIGWKDGISAIYTLFKYRLTDK